MIVEGLSLTLNQQHHETEFRSSQFLRSTSIEPSLRNMHSPEDSNAAAILFNAAGSESPSPLDLANLAGLNRSMSSQMLAAQQAALQAQRKQREFIPDTKKDDSYWDRRRRNNEAAKRSREKRRLNDMVLEQRVLELYKENHVLRAQLSAIREKYGVTGENLISVEQVLASLPSLEQLVSVTRSRSRATSSLSPASPILSLGSPQSLPPSLASPSIPQQQRQSVLMTISRHQDSSLPPTPCEERQPLQFERRHSSEESSKASSRWLPPIPALNPVNGTNKSLQGEIPKVVPYYDICSPGSSHSCDEGSQSPVDPAVSGRLLPHKLRHKTHLGERDAAAAAALLTLNDIKDEQELLEEDNLRSAGSSDERDSGVSTADWIRTRAASESEEQPVAKKMKHSEVMKPAGNDEEIRSQISRLVSEVERLKNLVSATRGTQFLH